MAPAPDIFAIIPARHASVRLPGKPLVDIGGKPIVQHVVERANEASLVTRVVVVTDHEAVAAAVRRFGGEAVMTPADLPSGTDRIAFFAKTLPGNPILVNVQGDEPFVTGGMIDAAVRPLLDDPAVVTGTVVAPVSGEDELRDPAVVKVAVALNGNALYFSRSTIPYNRDGGPCTVYRHFGLYAYRRDFLMMIASWEPTPLETAEKLEQLRILEHGFPIRVTSGNFETVSVDTPGDLAKARKFYKDRHRTLGA
ncbi:MAG TPA: 3-deoxy-manno-octulosonate cytidylyltransferase [Bacteroidota bacterium]|nr:3-deoxy-manno-octulosonate cytidylyltransferase [Bacteroidota bacterium]